MRHSGVAAVVCALVAGCGGGERAEPPPLPRGLAESLADRSDAVANRLEAGDDCAARAEAEALQADAIAAVNDHRIPARYQEELLGSVTALLESISCTPPPADDDAEEEDDGGRGKGKGKGNGNGKKDRD